VLWWAILSFPACAQPTIRPGTEPESAAAATAYPVPVPGPMPSSGGFRPPTEAGRGDAPAAIEARPRPPSTVIPGKPPRLPPPAPMTRLSRITENGVSYVCGGIGLDEAEDMKAAAREYDLMLIFSARDGSYLADVNVDIADAQDNSLLKVSCNGPIMLVDLSSPGSYRVRAEVGGATVSRNIRVGAEQGRSLVLVWPASQNPGESGKSKPED
jgi:hypothetical protein